MALAVQVDVVDLKAIITFQTVYNCFLQQQTVEPQKWHHWLLILWSGTLLNLFVQLLIIFEN